MRLRPLATDEDIESHPALQAFAKHPGNETRLIESSLAQTPYVQRYRDDKIECDIREVLKGLSQELRQRWDPVKLSAELQLIDPVSHRAGVLYS